MATKFSRRTLIVRAMQLPLAGSVTLGLSACGDDRPSTSRSEALCANPSDIDDSTWSYMQSSGYVENAPEQQNCSGCRYFGNENVTADCGSCEMFDVSVSRNGYCYLWGAGS